MDQPCAWRGVLESPHVRQPNCQGRHREDQYFAAVIAHTVAQIAKGLQPHYYDTRFDIFYVDIHCVED